jgi:hypothetical protein
MHPRPFAGGFYLSQKFTGSDEHTFRHTQVSGRVGQSKAVVNTLVRI